VTAVHRTGPPSRSVVPDLDLLRAISTSFRPDSVVRVERQLSRYSTSATVEDVTVVLTDGSAVALLLKDLSPEALLDGARAGKPGFLADPAREMWAYRQLLPGSAAHRPARCLAAVDEGHHRWLLLEKVPGVELYQVGDLAVWVEAAAALAALHRDLTDRLGHVPEARAHLLKQDATHLHAWMQRALRFEVRRGGGRLAALEALAPVHDGVVAVLGELPEVVVHGDLYASNVLVVRSDPVRVCAIDWEMVSVGPAVLDLAALTSGSWLDDERHVMAKAYWSAMDDPRWRPDLDEFLRVLDLARLHLCVQWLGWSPDWTPPPEHAHDWLREARALARRLE